MTNLVSKLYAEFDGDPQPIVLFMQWLVGSYSLDPNARLHVLDVGCGPGRLLEAYGQLGWHVNGLEPDENFVQEAEKVATKFDTVSVQKGGFEAINEQENYDLIAAVNDPFLYLLDIDQRIDALRRMHSALKPSGVMFLELKNFLHKLRYYQPVVEEESVVDGKKVIHRMHHSIDFHNAVWIHRDEYLIDGEIQGTDEIARTDKVAIITPPELFYLVRQQGFINICTYNSYTARESERLNSGRFLLSAQKPS
jgi:SAM-dependent methyltransferase